MFTQSAFSDPDIMQVELKNYIETKHKNLGWNRLLVDELKDQVDISFENADSFFKFDETIVKDALGDYQEEFIRITAEFTGENTAVGGGNPNLLPNYQKVLGTIASLRESQDGINQLTGLELAQNVTQDQLVEVSEQLEEGRKEALDRYIPYIIGGAAAYFILPKLFSTYLQK